MTAPKRPASAGRKPAKPSPRSAARPAAKPSARPVAKPSAPPAVKPASGNAAKPSMKAGAKPVARPPAKPAAAAAKTGVKAAVKPAPPPEPEKKPVPEKVPPRGQLVPRLHRALKASYKPFAAPLTRPLLEQVLLACCLENAPPEAAERAFARLMEAYFDLNEVRVTTVAELAETLHDLPDPARAALSLRRVLQSVFESTYNFSLEHARKHSLAHGLRTLESLHGVPPFVVQYVASTALGGHVIPLDRGALGALWLCGLITRQEYDAGKVPGLERVIGKKSGVEFAALLHQFGVDCLTNLHGATVRKVALATNPAAKDRFPKRGEPLPEPVPPPPPTGREGQRAADAARTAAEEHRPAGPQAAARPAGKTPQPPAGSGPKRTDGKPGGKPGPKPFVVKPNVGKPLTIKPQVAAPPTPPLPDAGRKPPEKAAAKPGKTPPPPPKRPAARPAKPADTRHSASLGKRKPR